MKHASLQPLFDQALAAFPYPLEPTSITQGTLDDPDTTEVEYAEEHTFAAGHLLDDELTAGGWIELRADGPDVSVSAFFGVARNGDWQQGRILPENLALQGSYDPETSTWELWLDSY